MCAAYGAGFGGIQRNADAGLGKLLGKLLKFQHHVAGRLGVSLHLRVVRGVSASAS